MYDFKSLVKKYSKVAPYVQTETAGHFDYANGGEWVPGTVAWVSFEGALVPLNNRDLTYDETGTYNTDDRKLYTYNDYKTIIKQGKRLSTKISFTQSIKNVIMQILTVV